MTRVPRPLLTTSKAGADVRILAEDETLLRALTLDPSYQPLGGRWPVHNVLRQASNMT